MKRLLLCCLVLSFFGSYDGLAHAFTSLFDVKSITLHVFQAKQDGNAVELNWEFESEQENLTGHLERSMDGRTFTQVYSFGVSATQTKSTYQFSDKAVKNGKYFYRLVITKNGYMPFTSNVITVNVTKRELTTYCYAVSQANMMVSTQISTTGKITVDLTDMHGRLKSHAIFADKDQIRIPTVNLSNGLYVLKLYEAETKKPILTRIIYKL